MTLIESKASLLGDLGAHVIADNGGFQAKMLKGIELSRRNGDLKNVVILPAAQRDVIDAFEKAKDVFVGRASSDGEGFPAII